MSKSTYPSPSNVASSIPSSPFRPYVAVCPVQTIEQDDQVRRTFDSTVTRLNLRDMIDFYDMRAEEARALANDLRALDANAR